MAAAPRRQMQMLVTRFERLSRRLSLAGLLSGNRAVEAIAAGRVHVDGRVATSNFKIFSEATVTLDDADVPAPRPLPRLWAMHKPRKVLCQDADKEGVRTLRSLLREYYEREITYNGKARGVGLATETLADKHFIIVCGLEFMADGLVLLTNDGLFAEALHSTESRIMTAYEVKISGDPPVDLLHSWRRGARAGGVYFGQVFCSITWRTGTTTRLMLRLVESPQRPVELLLEKAKLKVIAFRRHAFGPYLVTQVPKFRCIELPVDQSLMHLVPRADMRQVLVPSRGAITTREGAIRSVVLEESAVLPRPPAAPAAAPAAAWEPPPAAADARTEMY